MTANIDIVRAHYAASAQGNVREMMVNVSPQVHWTEMAGFRRIAGSGFSMYDEALAKALEAPAKGAFRLIHESLPKSPRKSATLTARSV